MTRFRRAVPNGTYGEMRSGRNGAQHFTLIGSGLRSFSEPAIVVTGAGPAAVARNTAVFPGHRVGNSSKRKSPPAPFMKPMAATESRGLPTRDEYYRPA